MDLVTYALLAFGSLFAILSPFATVPAFLALTDQDTSADRIAMARRACLVAFGVLFAFAVLGSEILGAFRVSVPALRIAGGLVILRFAFEMLQGAQRRLTPEERAEGRAKHDVAITPLAVPVLCGPGTITTGIVLGAEAQGLLQYAALVASGAIIYAITYALLWVAVTYSTFLGETPVRVMGRLMGLLLAAIAVQFLLDGLQQALPGAFPPHA